METLKAGWKTSEFWISVAMALMSFFLASGALGEEHLAVRITQFVVAALTTMGYSISRGLAKHNQAFAVEPAAEPLDLPAE